MRRRKLFTLAAGASAVLCIAVCVLWVRGYFAADRLFWQGWEDEGDRSYWRQDLILSGRGSVGMNRIVQSGPRESYRMAIDRMLARNQMLARSGPVHFHDTLPAAYPDFHFGDDDPVWGGFKRRVHSYMEAGRTRPKTYGWEVVVPYWALFAATAALPLAWGWRWRRRRRLIAVGHCVACGYDLRATPDRCPECGTAAGGAGAAAEPAPAEPVAPRPPAR
jgi:hypothetical protein